MNESNPKSNINISVLTKDPFTICHTKLIKELKLLKNSFRVNEVHINHYAISKNDNMYIAIEVINTNLYSLFSNSNLLNKGIISQYFLIAVKQSLPSC